MNNSSVAKSTEKKTLMQRFLDMIEIGGNKLPHPIMLFAVLTLAIVVLSAICSALAFAISY